MRKNKIWNTAEWNIYVCWERMHAMLLFYLSHPLPCTLLAYTLTLGTWNLDWNINIALCAESNPVLSIVLQYELLYSVHSVVELSSVHYRSTASVLAVHWSWLWVESSERQVLRELFSQFSWAAQSSDTTLPQLFWHWMVQSSTVSILPI